MRSKFTMIICFVFLLMTSANLNLLIWPETSATCGTVHWLKQQQCGSQKNPTLSRAKMASLTPIHFPKFHTQLGVLSVYIIRSIPSHCWTKAFSKCFQLPATSNHCLDSFATLDNVWELFTHNHNYSTLTVHVADMTHAFPSNSKGIKNFIF